MKLKLRVHDPKKPKLTIKEAIDQKIDIKNLDDRWNCKKEFEIPERLILDLIDDLIDKVVDMNRFNHFEGEKSNSLKGEISFNEANSLLKAARSWKKIHIMIADSNCDTSRFTRLDLLEQLLNIPEMKKKMDQRIHEINLKSEGAKISEEKSPKEIEPHTTAPRIHQSLFTEFVNKVN